MLNVKLKPFRYPLMYHIYERNMFNNDCYNYKFWDDGVNLLIKSFPECKKYFDYCSDIAEGLSHGNLKKVFIGYLIENSKLQ